MPPRKRKDARVPLTPPVATPTKMQDGREKTLLGTPVPRRDTRVEPAPPWKEVYSPALWPAKGDEAKVSGHTGPFVEAERPLTYSPLGQKVERYQAFISEPSSVLSSGQFPASYTAGPRSDDGTTDASPNTSSLSANFRGSATRNWEGAR